MGLQRTEQLMHACGNPHKGLSVIQVAGTNGKGSVSAMLATILKFAGYKTGLFTSPHLVKVNERIRINGTSISEKKMCSFIQEYKNSIDSLEASFFESITAMAFWYFKRENVDIAIMETGLGGRLDSVSVCEPIATVMTSISMDHMEILGQTIEEIAMEKSGSIKPGVPCFSMQQTVEVKQILKYQAKKKQTKIEFVNGVKNLNFSINLPGKIHIENALLAIETIKQLPNINISSSIIQKGLQSVNWHGRNQIIQKNPFIIFDVAHNLDSIVNFLHYYEKLKIKGDSILVIALQARKRIDDAVSRVESHFSKIFCTEAGDRNPMSLDNLSGKFSNKSNVTTCKSPHEALQLAIQALPSNGGLAIIGSHYLGPAVASTFKLSFASI